MILVKVAALQGFGDATAKPDGYGNGDWFAVNSFSFGIEREMQESGEQGGTEDINIGVGELQECTVSKSMDRTSPRLAQFAINGNSPGEAEVHFFDGSGRRARLYMIYKLDRCFVKSWSTSGDADDRPTEEVAFYYNKIAFVFAGQPAAFNWNRATNAPWEHGLIPPVVAERLETGGELPE